ncbi:MAG: hypothetical protein ACK53L_32030 [Pirellulaceae bacterium]
MTASQASRWRLAKGASHVRTQISSCPLTRTPAGLKDAATRPLAGVGCSPGSST